ncbi:MAG: M20/M25/M40 family metallo-hydrolase [Elainella sp.]
MTQPLLPDLETTLLQHLKQLTRERDPFLARAGHFYVQQYLGQQFDQISQATPGNSSTSHSFEFQGRTHQNLILSCPVPSPQRGSQQGLLLIGAHYDAVPGSPGADDNATGLAALLVLAAALSAQPLPYPVQFVAFDLEEYGLLGSRAYVETLRQQQTPIRLMISLEMLGYCDSAPYSQRYPPGLKYFYPKQGDFIALIGNWPTLPDLLRLSRAIRRTGTACEWLPAGRRGQIVPDTRRSDHAPFWDAGYPALMVTDTANLRNPHYHQPTDRLETINLQFLAGVCRGLIAGLQRL